MDANVNYNENEQITPEMQKYIDYVVAPGYEEKCEKVRQKIIRHLSEKYNEEFVIDGAYTKVGFLPSYGCTIVLNMPNNPRWRISARYQEIFPEGVDETSIEETAFYTPEEVYADNYCSFYFREKMGEYLAKPMQDILGENAKIVIGIPGGEVLEDSINTGTAIEEFVAKCILKMGIYTDKTPDNSEEDIERVEKYFDGKQTDGTVRIYYVETEVLSKIDSKNPIFYNFHDIPKLKEEIVWIATPEIKETGKKLDEALENLKNIGK